MTRKISKVMKAVTLESVLEVFLCFDRLSPSVRSNVIGTHCYEESLVAVDFECLMNTITWAGG